MGRAKPRTTDERRRLALQLATQLPEGLDDALAVLDDTRELLLNFLVTGPRELEAPSPVLELTASIAAPRPAMRLAAAWGMIVPAFLFGLLLDPPTPLQTQQLADLVTRALAAAPPL